ncbi:hypothetical protein V6N13_048445 [Hibiscus sabdariffa]
MEPRSVTLSLRLTLKRLGSRDLSSKRVGTKLKSIVGDGDLKLLMLFCPFLQAAIMVVGRVGGRDRQRGSHMDGQDEGRGAE